MKIDMKTLREVVKQELTEVCGAEAENAQQAVAGAQSVSLSKLPFEQWADQVVQMSGRMSVNELPKYINYYDAWMAGVAPESIIDTIK